MEYGGLAAYAVRRNSSANTSPWRSSAWPCCVNAWVMACPLPLKGLPLPLQRLTYDTGAFPHIGGHLVNLFVAPAAGLLHLRPSPKRLPPVPHY